MSGKDTPGLPMPPPAFFAGALVLGWLMQRMAPRPLLPGAAALIPGFVLVAAAVILGGAAVLEMRRARTAVNPYEPSATLVTTGPFALSRNPIYVALTLVSLGVALLLNMLWCAVLLVPAVLGLHYFVITREEAYLERRFGEAYRRYRAATRRWI